MFAAVFVASRFFFNRFVAFRIKPIYQILLSKSVRTHELSQKADPVGHIEDELNRWAEKNAREIARLKENERYRKEFLGNVSHEIKTPIFTLQGYIVTLLDGAIEDKAVNRKYLERSEKNIDRLIDFAKANGGIEYAGQRMQAYHDKAVEVLLTMPESEARDGLLLLADYIVERQK